MSTRSEQKTRPVVRGADRGDDSVLQPLAAGWLEAFRDLARGWGDVRKKRSIVSDLLAGLTVAAVALPLNVALARASGLPASAGLIAGAVGGIIAGALGGASLQVTGPAAALSTMVLGIAATHGAVGVAAATVMIGIIQLLMAALLAGRAAKFVPESVLAGFTTGVGLKILDQQIPNLLGFELLGKDYKFVDMAKMMHEPAWLHHVSWQSVVCGLFVAFLVATTKQYKRFPAAIVGIAVVTFISVYLKWEIARVGELPSSLPRPSLPLVADEKWLDIFLLALPLGFLASVESLLSAGAIDRMAGPDIRKHNPNTELFGQGVANFAVGLMSGMPVTGVIVRSGVNVQSGGKTRLSAIVHGVMLLIAVLFLSQTIGTIPEAALAGLLLVIGVRLIELKTLVKLARREKIEAVAFIAAAAGTVSGHLMTGLIAGGVLHAIHAFLHRRAERDERTTAEHKQRGIRAILDAERAEARRPYTETESPSAHTWLPNVRERAHVARTAYVHDKANVAGRVVLGEHVHIAAGSSVRADEGTPFFIGANSNVQDGVVIHALKNRRVQVAGEEWAVYIGKNVSIAHDALVHGPCYVGDETFIGFKAVVHDSIVGAHCFIGIGAVVVGVEIPDGKFVPHGMIVDSADAVDRLPDVSDAQAEFNEDVVDVNRGLAAAYHALDAPPRRSARNGESAPEVEPAAWDERWQRNASDRSRF